MEPRPLAVTVLAFAGNVAGVFLGVAGVVLAVLGALGVPIGPPPEAAARGQGTGAQPPPALLAGAAFLAGGVALVLAWGVSKGRKWAWWAALVVALLFILIAIFPANLVAFLAGAGLLYLLTRPPVVAYFAPVAR